MAASTTPTVPERTTWTPSGEPDRPSWGWIWQAVSGVLVLGLITLHMIANHFVVKQGLRDFKDVVQFKLAGGWRPKDA